MKKSTIIIILIVYLASIVVVGFFGMKVKVYDKVLYVKSIEMNVQAESKEMYQFVDLGIDAQTQNKSYSLTIYFTQNHLVDGTGQEYLPVILMPQITYDSGDVAGETESIKYSITSKYNPEEKGEASLSQKGELRCFKAGKAFTILVSPETSSLVGSSAIIKVFVI